MPSFLEKYTPDLAAYEDLYRHFHANPELTFFEKETAAKCASHLRSLTSDFIIRTDIGGHGLIAILKNGEGKIVLLRADMDALPIREATGLEYASQKTMKDHEGIEKPVMHACGHDFHMSSLLGAAETLIRGRSEWSGTLVFLLQPAEERGAGARAMIADGLYDPDKHACPIPDVCIGAHVFPMLAGSINSKSGTCMSAADSFKITLYGKGGHGSMPHTTVDPIVLASSVIMKLQTIVSREVSPLETAVVTVGQVTAGITENIIVDEAVLKINIRTMTEKLREHVLEAVKRIVRAECVAARSPKEPLFEPTTQYDLLVNEDTTTKTVQQAFTEHFGGRHDANSEAHLASEDFGILATHIKRPSFFFFYGGYPKEAFEAGGNIAYNHNAHFAPILQPTLQTGMEGYVVAALAFVGKK